MSYTRDNKRYRYDFHDYLRDNGTEVRQYNSAENTTNIVYTVTGGTLYMDCATLCTQIQTTTVDLNCQLGIRDASDVIQYRIFFHRSSGEKQTVTSNATLPTLLTVPVNYDVFVDSSAADIRGYAFIHGWVI